MPTAPRKVRGPKRPGYTAKLRNAQARMAKADANRDLEARKLYNKSWSRRSKRLRREFPSCALCFEKGKIVTATVVDHWLPHRGDRDLFWMESNHIPLCKPCHDGPKRRMEVGFKRTGNLRKPPRLVSIEMVAEFYVGKAQKRHLGKEG